MIFTAKIGELLMGNPYCLLAVGFLGAVVGKPRKNGKVYCGFPMFYCGFIVVFLCFIVFPKQIKNGGK